MDTQYRNKFLISHNYFSHNNQEYMELNEHQLGDCSNISVAAAYNAIAGDYANRFREELDGKPLDRALLRCFAQLIANDITPVLDLGCGTGRVVQYLHKLGLNVRGVDLSDEMIRQASRNYPNLRFSVASMFKLPFDDGSIGGAISMYSIVHFPSDGLACVFREISRVLAPKSYLLVVFQTGARTLRIKEAFGKPLDLTFYRHEIATVRTLLESAGFTVWMEAVREPDDHERARQAYLMVQRAEFDLGPRPCGAPG
jgi:SAM-dependent methyltransferase